MNHSLRYFLGRNQTFVREDQWSEALTMLEAAETCPHGIHGKLKDDVLAEIVGVGSRDQSLEESSVRDDHDENQVVLSLRSCYIRCLRDCGPRSPLCR